MRRFLHRLLATLTQHPREMVSLELYPNSWTSTCFRLWEWAVGRRAGIRRYNSVAYRMIDGKRKQLVQFHCLEAALAYTEFLVRESFRFKFAPLRIYLPVTTNGFLMPSPSPYLFAIARDTTTNFGGGSGITTVTYANYPMASTTTGALFFGMYGVNGASDTVTAQTFGGVAMTKLAIRCTGYRWSYLMYLLGASGTASIVITFSADPAGTDGAGFSYTGCATSAIDSTNTANVSAASQTLSTTVVAVGCWLAAFFLDTTGGTGQTAGAGTSQLRGATNNFAIYDSGAVVGTGSQSLIANQSASGAWGSCIASFSPSAGISFAPWFFFPF